MSDAGKPKRGTHHDRGKSSIKASTRAPLGPLIGAALIAILLGGVAALLTILPQGPAPSAPSSTPAIGGPFAMVDQQGRRADKSRLDGRWSAVFFGYVSCPDTCPATLQTLAAVQQRLGAAADRFQVVFVTVDPQRDTPKQLRAYLDQPGFPKGTLGLTGSPAEVASITRAYRVYYAKAPRADGGYDMDHSAAIYLMDPRGRFVAPMSESAGPDALATQVRAAMRTG